MLNLNYRDSRPIYEQIKEGLRKLVISSAMKADERLPSVRELAAGMAINPNTIQRAYRELEAEGYIYSVPGKGSFVSERGAVNTERRDVLLKQFDEAAAELFYMGGNPDFLKGRIDELYERQEGRWINQ